MIHTCGVWAVATLLTSVCASASIRIRCDIPRYWYTVALLPDLSCPLRVREYVSTLAQTWLSKGQTMAADDANDGGSV